MPDRASLALADASLRHTIRHLTRHAGGGRLDERDGLLLFAGACDAQHPYVNGVIRTDGSISPTKVVQRAHGFFAASGRPFSVWAGAHCDADIEAFVRRAEYSSYRAEGSPGMMLDHDPGAADAAPDFDLAVVDSSNRHRDFVAVTTEAYAHAMTAEVTQAIFADIAVIAGPNARAFVASGAGVPVAAAMVTVYDGLGEIGFVGTVPAARGSGLGRLVTQACAHDAFARGATNVFLQASTMGEPVYRALGFMELTRYAKFDVPR